MVERTKHILSVKSAVEEKIVKWSLTPRRYRAYKIVDNRKKQQPLRDAREIVLESWETICATGPFFWKLEAFDVKARRGFDRTFCRTEMRLHYHTKLNRHLGG